MMRVKRRRRLRARMICKSLFCERCGSARDGWMVVSVPREDILFFSGGLAWM